MGRNEIQSSYLGCRVNCHLFLQLSGRYRQVLEKAIQLSGVEQLEALKAFVEASEFIKLQLVLHDAVVHTELQSGKGF